MNGQRVDPFYNLNWQQGGAILGGAVGGAAGVGAARLAGGLASSTTVLVGGTIVPIPGSFAEAVATGIGSGYAESSAFLPKK